MVLLLQSHQPCQLDKALHRIEFQTAESANHSPPGKFMYAALLILSTFFQTSVVQTSAGENLPASGGQMVVPARLMEGVPAGDSASRLQVREVDLDQLRSLLTPGSYIPMPYDLLGSLAEAVEQDPLPAGVSDPPRIRHVRYQAVLVENRLQDGSLEMDLESQNVTRQSEPLLLGRTSLQQLRILDGDGEATIGADRQRRLFLLNPDTARRWKGTWSAEGMVTGDFVTFRLDLPPAITSQFTVVTPALVQVSSSNGLVLSPQQEGELLRWRIFPNVASRVTLTCRTRRIAAAGTVFSLADVSSVHAVAGDSLSSRWTMSLPAELQGRNVFVVDVPTTARIIDVLMNENQPLEWSSAQHGDVQQLRLVLPPVSSPTAISILAVSVWPQSDVLSIPILTPRTWERRGTPDSGPILLPASQIRLTVPPGIDLDGWTLKGIQERDVIAGPDNSRTFQLVRYGPDASAEARFSTSQARLLSSIVTVLDASGRLANARCFISVRCEESAVVELAWPVSAGWDVIAARYTSSGRSLFFEFSESDSVQGEAKLLVHLPETLEPQSSRIIDIQFQQSEWPQGTRARLPLRLTPAPAEPAQRELLIVSPGAQQSSTSGRLWRNRGRVLPQETVKQQYPWIPEMISLANSVVYELSPDENLGSEGGEESNLESSDEFDEQTSGPVVTYQASREKEIVRESAVFVIPARNITSEVLEFQIGTENSTDSDSLSTEVMAGLMKWTVNSQPVIATRIESQPQNPDVQRWVIPITRLPDPDSDVTISFETQRSTGESFLAMLPFPQGAGVPTGHLELVQPSVGAMVVDGLTEMSPSRGDGSASTGQSRYFRLPEAPADLRIRIERIQTLRQGEVIDTHVFHLIEDRDTTIVHDVMAIARLRRPGNRVTIPLSLPKDVQPVAFVDGSRVQLISSADQLLLPLPTKQDECHVILLWRQEIGKHSLMTTEVPLSTLFQPENQAEQSTHHLLVASDLELLSPGVTWAATVHVDAMEMLPENRSYTAPLVSTEGSTMMTVMTAPRGFLARWELASSTGWQHRTLATSSLEATTISVRVSSLSIRRALQYAAILVSLTACSVLLPLITRFRRPLAVFLLLLAGSRLLISSVAADALICGTFWGLCGGFILSFVFCWRPLPRPSLKPVSAIVVSSLLMFSSAVSGQEKTAQPVNRSEPLSVTSFKPQASDGTPEIPQVLVLKNGDLKPDLIHVHDSLYRKWKSLQQNVSSSPQVVVTRQSVRIRADSIASVEAELLMDVAVATSDRTSVLEIPLNGTRLVECSIDGEVVLPIAGDNDSVLIPIPGVVLVPFHKLSVDEGTDLPMTAGIMEPGPSLSWDIHKIECRLRPLVVRQANAMQFRLPALPCPSTTLSVDSESSFVRRAFVRTGSGVLQWSPSDGLVPLSSIQLADGLEVRLFSDEQQPEPGNIPGIQVLALCEMSSGQQLLTCVCQFSQWNPLVHNIRIRIPEGYRLITVSSSSVAELFWSVRDGTADLQLNDLNTDSFEVEMKLLCEAPVEPQQHRVKMAELGLVAGCRRSENAWVAVRTTPEFSIQPVGNDVRSGIPASEVPAVFAGWLRRSDAVFLVPSNSPELTLHLVPRTSYSEVRVATAVECEEGWIDWTYTADIETAVLNRFRHQMIVDPSIEITDVQVFAGEANRLDKRYRRGDRLTILLKEGTIGLYRLIVRGRQMIPQDESEIRLRCPQLPDVQILESSLTIVDNSQSGFILADTGKAVPDRRLPPNQILTPGLSMRFQIIDEEDPIVLQRRSLSARDASLAVIRHEDRAMVLLQIHDFPAAADADRMLFSSDVVFLEPPRILLNGQQRNTVRTGNEFRWIEAESPENGTLLTACWTVPLRADMVDSENQLVPLPRFSFDLKWKQSVVSETLSLSEETDQSSQEALKSFSPLTEPDVPAPSESGRTAGRFEWVSKALEKLEIEDVPSSVSWRSMELSPASGPANAVLPGALPEPVPEPAARSTPVIVADTMLLVSPHQSAVAETTLFVFAPQAGTRVTLQIPRETIVTHVETDRPVRWDTASRNRLTLDPKEPMTTIRLRWLSERATGSMFVTKLKFSPPLPDSPGLHHLITVRAADGGASYLQRPSASMNREKFRQRLFECLQEGFRQLSASKVNGELSELVNIDDSSGKTLNTSGDPDASHLVEERVQEIMNRLSQSHQSFLVSARPEAAKDEDSAEGLASGPGTWRIYAGPFSSAAAETVSADVSGAVSVMIRRIPPFSTVLASVVAIAIALVSFVGRNESGSLTDISEPAVAEDLSGSALSATRVQSQEQLASNSASGDSRQ